MASAKKRSEQHLIDQAGERLLREKLPPHWLLREYRPDYGLDFTIEIFTTGEVADGRPTTYETLGEHVFVQLKSIADATPAPLALYSRGNVEKAPEALNRTDKVADLETYRFQLETSELITVERMGIGVPVLLVIADLARQSCSFVCLNDYVDKILTPRHGDYRDKATRTIHVPTRTAVGSEVGQMALRWYAKRPKLIAAFQRFTYQFSELNWAAEGDWRTLANYFAHRIAAYDFWHDTEMCGLIAYLGEGLRRFIENGQPGFFKPPVEPPEGFDPDSFAADYARLDVFELWRQLSLLPKTYEDVWREWFLPTALGELASAPP